MSYAVQLITPEEKDHLYQSYESRFLYTNKAEIYGCCVKLLTEVEHVKTVWEDKNSCTFIVKNIVSERKKEIQPQNRVFLSLLKEENACVEADICRY